MALQHFEMNMNVAYVAAGDAIPATQNVAYGQVPPGTGTGTDDCYDYVIWFLILPQLFVMNAEKLNYHVQLI